MKRFIEPTRMIKLHSALVALFIALGFCASAQSGWTQPKGKGFYKLSQDILIANDYFDPDGEVLGITKTSIFSTNAYAEYGIVPRLTGVVNVPVFVRSSVEGGEDPVDGSTVESDELGAFGDVRIGLKYGIVQEGGIVVSAYGEVKLPTGENTGGDSELLQSGDGAWGFTGLVAASHSFYPKPFYISLFAGYQWRGEADLEYNTATETVNYDDAARWGFEFGWQPGKNWNLALKINHVIALDNGTGGGITGSTSIYGNSLSYFGITPEVAYILDNGLGFSFGIGSAAGGKNLLAAPNFMVGVLYVVK